MSLLHRTHHEDDQADDTAVVERPHQIQEDPEVPVTDRDGDTVTMTERTWTFAPSQVVSLAVGIGLVALGLLAMLRAGIDGSFAQPVVDVLGFSHTAWLGLAEVGVGVLLVLAGTGAWGRPLSVVVGAGMMIAGVLIGAEPSQIPEELGVEQDFGWGVVLLGALVSLAAMVLPVWRSRKVRRDGAVVPADRDPLVSH